MSVGETSFDLMLKRDSKQLVTSFIEKMKLDLNGAPIIFAKHGVQLIKSKKTSQTAVLDYIDAVANLSTLTRKAGTWFHNERPSKPFLQVDGKTCHPCEVFQADSITWEERLIFDVQKIRGLYFYNTRNSSGDEEAFWQHHPSLREIHEKDEGQVCIA
jgi:hypothetical protein